MDRAVFRNRFATLMLAAVSCSGCFRAQARTTPDVPALQVPAPPPRIVEPTDTPAPQPGALVEEPARTPPPRVPPPAPSPPRTDPPRADPRVEAAPEPPKPAEETAPTQPPATLQTAPSTREVEWERRIRNLLTTAGANLNRVNPRLLDANAQGQYDQARRFMVQAEEALRAKNLVYADNLADKAATLAAQLSGR
jgi:hypothetical protein